MSWLGEGRGKNNYSRHKTYESKRVQKRLDEILPVVQSKVEQALDVDSTRVIIYKRAKLGLPCSCTMTSNEIIDELDGVDQSISRSDTIDGGVTLRPSNQGMFGGMGNTQGTNVIDAASSLILEAGDLISSYGEDGEQDEFSINPYTGNVNCGICYRQGVQPGYQPHGYLYNVMSHYHVQEIRGYTIDKSSQPHSFERLTKDGEVVFNTLIPLYFTAATYSIRLNERVLEPRNKPKLRVIENSVKVVKELTYDLLDTLRGQEVEVVISGVDDFTHATLIFDQGIEYINGNLSEEQNVLNYDQELTVGNLQVVLPSKVGMLNPEDILVLPDRNYVLKINEATKRRTAKGTMWEWSVTTRAIQRKEYIYQIHKGYKVF